MRKEIILGRLNLIKDRLVSTRTMTPNIAEIVIEFAISDIMALKLLMGEKWNDRV